MPYVVCLMTSFLMIMEPIALMYPLSNSSNSISHGEIVLSCAVLFLKKEKEQQAELIL